MNIYVSHSKGYDYRNGLYIPITKSRISLEHDIILPHEFSSENYSSREFFQNMCDLMIAEVSFKGTGIGIEIGWADAFDVPIIAMHRKDADVPGSLKSVKNISSVISYSTPEDMIRKLEEKVDLFALSP